MKVLILGLGGVTSTFRNWPERVLALALTRRGHEVWNIGTRDASRPAIAQPRERIEGIEVRRVRPGYWPNRELDQALAEMPRPDVIHFMHPRNTLAAQTTRWADARGIPTVYTWLGPFHDPYLVQDRERPFDHPPRYDNLVFTRSELLLRLLRPRGPRATRELVRNYRLHWPLKAARWLLPCSEFEADVMRRMGLEQPSTVVPLWIDWSGARMPAGSVRPGTVPAGAAGASRPWILFVGQLTPRKGYDIAIDALPLVRRHHPGATLLFVSGLNPAERQEAETRARERGVEEGVRFLGRVEDDELHALFAACDAYWTPTRYEGFGLTVLEAMAAGAPVVAADVPVVNEIVRHGRDGLLFRAGDASALAETTLGLLGDASQAARLREAGRQALGERFDGEVLAERFESAYLAALGQRGSEPPPRGDAEAVYFASQVSRSEAKVSRQYARILSRAGLDGRLASGGLALDLGCGAGPGLRFFAQRGLGAVGLDRSRYALEQARRLAAPRGLLEGDLGRGLPFREESFDLVLASEVIEHLHDGPAFLRECRRILRPGGVLLLTTPNLWDVRRFLFPLLGRIWSGYADPTHVNLYTPRRLHREMESAGLRPRVRTGMKPLLWLPPYRRGLSVPYPPWVGNGIVAAGTR
ncbi:MAG TPA: glycosyltransferase [Vicinamibacteria bacterium]|nr:glycosyltransferase [Vicinamibacteria bacterium]